MRIIFSNNISVEREHAKAMVKSLEETEMKQHVTQMRPKGVATHLARYPILCDECAKNYWAQDPYGSHIGCKGSPDKPVAGFGA